MAGAPGAARKRPTRPLSWRALWPALPRTPPTGGCIIRRAPYRHDGRRRWAPGRCHAARVPAKTTHPTVRLWGGESPRGAVEGARTAVVQAAPLPSPDEDSRHPWEWLRVCWLSDATARHERGAHGDGAWRSAGGVTYLRSGRLSHRVWRGVHPGHGPCVCGRRRCLGGGGGRVLVNGSRPGGALSQSGNWAVFQRKTRLRFRFTSHGRQYIQYSERRTTSPWLTRSASRKQR